MQLKTEFSPFIGKTFFRSLSFSQFLCCASFLSLSFYFMLREREREFTAISFEKMLWESNKERKAFLSDRERFSNARCWNCLCLKDLRVLKCLWVNCWKFTAENRYSSWNQLNCLCFMLHKYFFLKKTVQVFCNKTFVVNFWWNFDFLPSYLLVYL